MRWYIKDHISLSLPPIPDLMNVLKKLGLNLKNEKQNNKLITAADPNKKGVITFSKFVILMETNRKKDEQVWDLDS